MTKREKLEQRYVNASWGEVEVGLGQDLDKEGATLKNGEGSKFLDKEKHTSRGSMFMNLVVCICFVHIHVLACIA
jgi:hypothetical protein